MPCALSSNAEVAHQRQELDALAGSRLAGGRWLPLQPVLSVSAGGRWAGPQQAFNAYGTLAQEFEIGGQRAGRLDEVDAQVAAQVRRVAATENEISAEAMRAFVTFQSAVEAQRLAGELRTVGEELVTFARGRSREHMLSDLDARLLIAEGIQLQRLPAVADRRVVATRNDLLLVLGLSEEPQWGVADYEPVPLPPMTVEALVSRALVTRGDVGAAEAEMSIADAERARLERERVPNLTASINIGSDGFGEFIAGAGLSLPLPITGSAGSSKEGEIAVARVRRVQAETTTESVRRRVKAEVVRAFAELQSCQSELALFVPSEVAAARSDLNLLRKRMMSRELPVLEVLAAQRSLIDFLRGYLEARLALALASIELTRAAALPWSGDGHE